MSSKSPFNFTITAGSDELSIERCANAYYLRFGDPVAVIFSAIDPDYYDLTPHYKRFRREINQRIEDKLNTDFEGSETEFLELLEPVLSKLSNGKYLLSLRAEMQYQYTIRTAEWRDNEAALMELVIGKVIDPKQQERISTPEFIEEHSQSRFASNTYQLMQTTTTDIYEPFDEGDDYSYDHMLPILTTKPESALDSSAVRFFEEQIRKNECPVILLFHAFCEGEYWNVPHLLLDGHHKFKAYQNLGVVPKTAIITRIFSADSVRFTPDQLIDHLYTWQSMYVFRSTLFNDVQIKKMRENPESKVHEFILNGLVRTYHDNGQLEHEATYEYNRIEGTARGWYKNGQLEYENTSVDGLEFVKKRRYYESGSLQEEILRDEPGKGRYTKTVWYESGAKNVEADFHMGKYVEILPMRIWFENGQLQKEFIGDDHKNYEARIWNEEGEILEHFTIVNGVQNWMVKPPEVPVRSKAIEQSDPKKKSFDYRLFWIILIFVVVIANVILFFIGM